MSLGDECHAALRAQTRAELSVALDGSIPLVNGHGQYEVYKFMKRDCPETSLSSANMKRSRTGLNKTVSKRPFCV